VSEAAPDLQDDAWAALDAELDAWQAAGRTATAWWRDDDATRPGPKLDRLLALSVKTKAPVALAVIPARAEAALAPALAACPGASVLQHGYAHVNHAPRGQGLGAWELGLHRGRAAVLDDLAAGRDRFGDILDDRFVRVVAAPWNRIDPVLFPDLPGLGFRGVTAFGARAAARPVPGLHVNHGHCDPIDWKRETFAGTRKAVAQVIEHLEARRTGSADPDEATGLLTHHADMDAATWDFAEALLGRLTAHPAVRFVDARDLFA